MTWTYRRTCMCTRVKINSAPHVVKWQSTQNQLVHSPKKFWNFSFGNKTNCTHEIQRVEKDAVFFIQQMGRSRRISGISPTRPRRCLSLSQLILVRHAPLPSIQVRSSLLAPPDGCYDWDIFQTRSCAVAEKEGGNASLRSLSLGPSLPTRRRGSKLWVLLCTWAPIPNKL